MRKGVNQIDFAIAVFVMIVVIAFSMFYITSYFSRASPSDKTAELKASADMLEEILFWSEGIPVNWENNNYTPVRIGLKTGLARISITAVEKAGVNHSFEEIDTHIVFDRDCLNTTYNSSIRLYDQFMNETDFRIYNYTECTPNTGFLREANINLLSNITGNSSSIFWLYYTNNTATAKKSVYNFSYDSSLIGYWKLDSVNNTNYTLDSSGYGNDGQLKNYPCNPATCNLTAGQINSGLQFDGVDDYVNISDKPELRGGSPLVKTVGAWFSMHEISGDVDIVGKQLSTIQKDWVLEVYDGRLTFYSEANGEDYKCQQTTGAISTGAWYHGVFVVNEPNVKIYVNGELVGNCSNLNGNSTDTVASVEIGAATYALRYTNGTIDDVKIYNRSLTADEIKAHYNYTRPKYVISSVSIPAVADKKISALQNLSYSSVRESLDMKKNFNITACEYSFGRHIPETVNVLVSAYPIMLINSTGSVKTCLASVNVW